MLEHLAQEENQPSPSPRRETVPLRWRFHPVPPCLALGGKRSDAAQEEQASPLAPPPLPDAEGLPPRERAREVRLLGVSASWPFHRRRISQDGHPGRVRERVYWSRRRASPEQALQSLAYILEHPEKHGVDGGFDDENTSGRLYRRGTPDGVATAVLGVFFLRDPEVRWNAIVELLREMYADPRWKENGVDVAREAIERHPEVIDKKGWCAPIKVALWAGEEAAKRAREAVLSAPQVRVVFSPRKAPRIGGVVTFVIREAPSRPAPDPVPSDSS